MAPRDSKIKPVASTPFSDFIRNASVEEKEGVYTEVMRRASEEQRRLLTLKQATAKLEAIMPLSEAETDAIAADFKSARKAAAARK